MKLKDIGEFGLIGRISEGCLVRPENVIKAIGDDAAVFKTDGHALTLVTTDLLVERVHFLRETVEPAILGHKALAVNLSDIAAMGGIAREAFFSIAIPEDCPIEFIEDFYKGAKRLAAKYSVNILGGDTTRSLTDLIINIVVTGAVANEKVLLRSSAKPGDIIACTGFPGESKAGLHIILNHLQDTSDQGKQLFNAHVMPEPHLLEGQFLSASKGVHACIDVSDGLTSDLRHILDQSNVGAVLHAGKIPVSEELNHFCQTNQFDPIDYALSGGEDYFLLCTLTEKNAQMIAADFQQQFGRPLHFIGTISKDKGMRLVGSDGSQKEILPSGWDHFI